ncbi:hypothetical protein OGAPHI_001918 [Ogataea philodendri]|uniref:Bud site selection protein RAX2 n=2 Tax=Ogataea TaxID=461281 RepID=A0A9P8T768_9ASCO|nr:uncharacterized protein OGAPHI_001918 [Ogataea philodendri]KAH3668164.1 hypothetical protein OGAPHI_001918 [Ogataea philodendri]
MTFSMRLSHLLIPQMLQWMQASYGAVFDTTPLDQPSILEPVFFYGQFDSISNYSDVTKYNLTTGNRGIWALSAHNDSIVELKNTDASNVFSLDNSSFIYLEDGQPYIYNVDSKNTTELENWEDVEGTVNSVLLDDNLIYLGGDLSYNNYTGVVVYNRSNNTLSNTPFEGLNGTVNSIIHSNNNSIIFGGQFDSIGNSRLLSTNSTNSTIVDPDQLISLKYAQISSSSDSDPNSIVCPSESSEWLAQKHDTWSAELPNSVQPSKIRLYNLPGDDGVSLFRITTSPANGIMNLSYIDPQSLETSYCDAWCPLLPNSNLSSSLSDHVGEIQDNSYTTESNVSAGWVGFGANYQEFVFVNGIQVDQISVQVLDNYGNQAGLAGLELFQYGTTIYANNSLNEPTCSSTGSYSSASSLGDADWKSSDGYLTTTVSSSDIDGQGTQYDLNITYSGEYMVYLYTPGCLEDNTCDSRGVVNASFYDGTGMLSTKSIYQTNNEMKYDIIYSGYVDMESGSQPYLRVALESALYSDEVTLVSQSVYIQFVSLEVKQTNKVKLNGLFEYHPGSKGPFGDSSIDMIGSNLTENANITGLDIVNSTLYIAGDFSSDYGDNFVGVDLDDVEFKDITDNEQPISQLIALSNISLVVADDDSLDLYNGSFHELETFSHPFTASSFAYNSSQYVSVSSQGNTSVYDYTTHSWRTFDLAEFNISKTAEQNDVTYAVGEIVKYDSQAIDIAQIGNGTFAGVDIIKSGNVHSGLYVNKSLILGGKFTTTDGKDNLVFVNGSTPDIDFSNDSAVRLIYSYKDLILAAFDGTATINGSSGSGLLGYNLTSKSTYFLPSKLNGKILALSANPKDNSIVVGGNFTSDDCDYLCFFSPGNKTFSKPKNPVSGEVTHLQYLDTLQILASGSFSNSSFAVLNLNSTSVEPADRLDNVQLPNNIQRFAVAGKTLQDPIVVMSPTSLGYVNGSSYKSLDTDFESNSSFSDIELVNSSSSFLNKQVLLVSGELLSSEFGKAHVAAYNGHSWTPLVISGQSLNSSNANVTGLVKSFTAINYATNTTKTNTTTTSTPTSSPTSSSSPRKSPNKQHLTTGQVAGVGLALSVGTMLLLTAAGAGLYYVTNRSTRSAPLQSRVGEDKMVQAVPPNEVINNMDKAKVS